MTEIARVRVALTGWDGGPGVNTFYCLDPNPFLEQLRTFFDAINQFIPNDVTMQVSGVGDLLEAESGDLTGAFSITAPAAVLGENAGFFASPVGYVVHWLTPAIADGKHLRGRTFLVPIGGEGFNAGGGINTGWTATLQTAATVLCAAASDNFVVWHRPNAALDPPRVGSVGFATAAVIASKPAVLRSRRD